eukprot:gnl/MRDRNA2_/MRDRNA2_66074_c0_seq2.p1 gnl/MRDRNA2_/MRDRNA2_66074_c0~~gnl/MRDRNA2_/MRDRNA2_66074_c0_seq2.p1  ORF type:complete len:105 (+),score=2.74 gnl/MRDRNA2_/MRDRNA2_66074_c0_seq2:95-409(+)
MAMTPHNEQSKKEKSEKFKIKEQNVNEMRIAVVNSSNPWSRPRLNPRSSARFQPRSNVWSNPAQSETNLGQNEFEPCQSNRIHYESADSKRNICQPNRICSSHT